MTSNEAVTVIEAATDPRVLFGVDPHREYRRLARLTHPDAHPGSQRAAAAFAKLAALWQRYQGLPGGLIAVGDIANLYEHERGLLKIARDPADNNLLDREAAALQRLSSRSDSRFLAWVGSLFGGERSVTRGQ